MKPTITLAAATLLTCQGALAAQQTGTAEEPEAAEGIPATQHQEHAARELDTAKFTQLDEDGDGVISREEAQGEATLSENWSRFDKDGDGNLGQDEFSLYEQHMTSQEELARSRERRDTEREAGEGLPATPHQEEAVEGDLVGALDRDGDGEISQEEARADSRLAENWDQYDEDGDGRLDAQELEQFREEVEEAE